MHAALGSSGGRGGASSAARSGSSAGARFDIHNPFLEGTQARRVREHGAGARVGRSGAWGALTVREAVPLGGSGAGGTSNNSLGSSGGSGGRRTVTLPGQAAGTAEEEVGVSVLDGGGEGGEKGGGAQKMWPALPHWKRIGKGKREGLQ